MVIHDMIFRNRQNINWDDVELYLGQYIGEFYTIAESGEQIYIGKDLPDEYAHSSYSAKLKGTLAKTKANAVYNNDEEIERYNVFKARMIIRHDADGRKYLYDVINIKKEPSTPLG